MATKTSYRSNTGRNNFWVRERWTKSGKPGPWRLVYVTSGMEGVSGTVTSERSLPRFPSSKWMYLDPRGILRVQVGRPPSRYVRRLPNAFYSYQRYATGTSSDDESTWVGYPSGWQYQFRGNPITSKLGLPELPAYDLSTLQKAADSSLFQLASEPAFDGYTQMGELMESLAMLRSPLSTLRTHSVKLWHAFRKNTRGLQGRDLTEAVTGTWLEWSFGIQPLITSSAEIASRLVAALSEEAVEWKRLSTNRYAEKKESISVRSDVVAPRTYVNIVTKSYDVAGVKSGGWLVNAGRIRSRSALLGLGSMRAILSQAYALLPLSFALDWFIGVGPLLNECRPVNGKLVGTYRTSYKYRVEDCSVVNITGEGNTLGYHPCTRYGVANEITRITNLNPPGTIQMGPLLSSLSQGLSMAALAAGPMTSLWSKRPWH